MAQLDAIQTTAARVRIATLRGLYGDLAEHLDDADACNELRAQIEHERAQLAALTHGVDTPV
jgi:hypothetical protein